MVVGPTDPARRAVLLGRLGLGPDADAGEIKRAWRALARQHHPDKNPNGQERFREVQEAFEELSSPPDARPASAGSPPPESAPAGSDCHVWGSTEDLPGPAKSAVAAQFTELDHALYEATWADKLEAVRLLLKRGARPVDPFPPPPPRPLSGLPARRRGPSRGPGPT